MIECKPNELISPSPFSVIPEKDEAGLTIFNRFFCYIAHTFFSFRSAKKQNMTRLHKTETCTSRDGIAVDSTATSADQSDTSMRKARKCRLPVLIRNKKRKNSRDNSNAKNSKEIVPSNNDSLPATSKQSSIVSISESSSCHILTEPNETRARSKNCSVSTLRKQFSDRSIQAIPQKRVQIDPKATRKKSPLLAKEIQVGERNPTLELFTSQMEILPPPHGDSFTSNRTSPLSLTRPSSTQLAKSSSSSLSKRPIQKKRTFLNVNPPLIRNKGVSASEISKRTRKTPGPLKNESSKSLQLPPSLADSENIKTVQTVQAKVTNTISAQTMESWPILEKRLNMFEKTKKKSSKEKEKEKTLISSYVQAVPSPIQRANVKCLVHIEQANKGTLVRIGPNGMERVESCVNTEKSDSSSGIQCDIVLRKTVPKKISSKRIHFNTNDNIQPISSNQSLIFATGSTQSDELKSVASNKSNLTVTDVGQSDFVTVLPTRKMDPRVTRSELQANSMLAGEDPLHCLSEFLSLEQMLQRLQDEIRGLDKSIRQISNNYRFPTTLGSVSRRSFDSKLRSAESMVKNYQQELEATSEETPSDYLNYSNGEYR